MTLLAFWVDIRARKDKDYAFWLYLFGVFDVLGRPVVARLPIRRSASSSTAASTSR
jgi:hypothetical protein